MKPLLLFDMDGTLIIQEKKPKYEGTRTQYKSYLSIKSRMKQILIRHGVPEKRVIPLDRMALIWNTARRYLEENDYPLEEIESIMVEINGPFMEEERSDHDVSVLLPDTIDALETLKKQGYDMGLVTTASRESYDRISQHMDYGRFGGYFKHSLTRDEVKYIKPDPEPINRILENYNHNSFVYVGDSDHDALACKAAGGFFVLINTREYDDATLQEMRPDGVISRLIELPHLLEKHQ